MSNEVAVYTAPQGVSLVDIRLDSKTYPRIKNLTMQQAVGRLQQVVAMAYAYTGRPADENRLRMVATALYNEILNENNRLRLVNISIEEIAHAVKSAILSSDGDVFINIAFLYRAICNYAAGEGAVAQKIANEQYDEAQKKAIERSPVGAMLTTYTGRLLEHSTLKSHKK